MSHPVLARDLESIASNLTTRTNKIAMLLVPIGFSHFRHLHGGGKSTRGPAHGYDHHGCHRTLWAARLPLTGSKTSWGKSGKVSSLSKKAAFDLGNKSFRHF